MTVGTERRLPSGFRHFPGAVLQLDLDGHILESNGLLERDLSIDHLRGRRFADLLDPDSSHAKWDRVLASVLVPGDSRDTTWELILTGEDGLSEPRAFSIVLDEEARLLWLFEHRSDRRLDQLRDEMLGINSELARTQRELLKERSRLARALEELEEQHRRTERLARTVQEQNRELERSNRSLDEFAHVVSHDLKAPLRSISNHADWLIEDIGDTIPEENRTQLDRLRDRADRMSTMIQGVLEYARAGRSGAQPERVDVAELIADVLRLLDPPGTVELQVAPAMPVILAERAPLQQVLLNLVGNAIRYAGPDDPTVTIGWRRRPGFVELAVSDNGPGIEPRLQERIWGLFATLEPATESAGTGIGLAVVKTLVESRGGEVAVESTPGAGATFRILWPEQGETGAPIRG